MYPEKENKVDQVAGKFNGELMFSQKSDQHFTPKKILDLVHQQFGMIDLDPCCEDSNNPNVVARDYYTHIEDGLKQEWYGKVFVNPPYSATKLWVEKAIKEYQKGNAEEILMLLPARVDTKWHYLLDNYLRVYIKGRLKFIGNTNSAPFPSMVVYLGEELDDFVDVWKNSGTIFTAVN